MRYIDQRIFCDPNRNDGHDAEGNPGDCMNTTVANMMGLPYEKVPHFVLYLNWWNHARRWARSFEHDFICLLPEDAQRYLEPTDLFLGSGPSPRGDFWHCALYNGNLELVHDPHPARLGLVSLEECVVLVPFKTNHLVSQLMLTAGE